MIDNIDREILALLQEDARIANVDIARRLKMAPSAILERVRRLRKDGVIREFTARLDPEAVDFGLLAFVSIKTNEKRARWDVGGMMAKIPEVLEVHDIAGEDCYLVKLRTKDTASLYELLRDKLGANEAIASTKTTIVLHTSKDTTRLPIKKVSRLKPGEEGKA
ncbi:MAG: Lrp/AsnC family transcriptional regulator [Candidatus Aminicenantes bacterium]|nr:Lrp/AsnC family transcriptional regulator [Candidatus Aminicenantes bacterium]